MLVASSVPSSTQVADRLAVAVAAVKANASTAAGRAYQEVVGKAFGRDHSATVGQCARGVKRTDLSDFSAFIRVGRRGVVEEVLVKPATNLSACTQQRLAHWAVPEAPSADYWVSVDVRLRAK
jgi:hypothetical protein